MSARDARAWAVAVPAASLAAIGLILTWRVDARVGSVTVWLTIVALQTVSEAANLWLQSKGRVELWQPFAAVFTAALFLLPPSGVVSAFVVSTLVGLALGRMKPVALVYNVGQVTFDVCVAVGVYSVLTAGRDGTVWYVAAAFAAALVDEAVSHLWNGLYFWHVDGRPFAKQLLDGSAFASARLPPLVAMGVLAGITADSAGAIALLAIAPMIAFQVSVADHLQAKQDRERIRDLFDAANSAHASVRTEEVKDAVLNAAAGMLGCEHARLVSVPPEPDDGAAVELAGELAGTWLVVSGRKRGTEFEQDERDLLAALGAIGSSALGNAQLVERIQHQALHDPLTGLANQVLFEDRVRQVATSSRRNKERFAVMLLDLDAFKKVNDSLGHTRGNELLRLVGDRLAGATREIDTVARLGSDHFTLLLPGVGTPDQALLMAEKLLTAVRRPVTLGGHELFMTASIGVAFYPDDGTQPEHLLRNADSAMHRAKEMGRDSFQIYAAGMNDLAQLRLVRESELHNALERDELRLRYQPQIDVRTGRLVGVEALVRWDHPVLGLIGPNEFVPLAEESGLIVAVDEWVLRRACEQHQQWTEAGVPPIRVAVNLSGRHFNAAQRLLDTVNRALEATAMPPNLLELEVTESVAVGETEAAGRVLQQVRDLGVRLAIDDFGTGYSVLGRLRSFPVDSLKIDRSFVSEIVGPDPEAPIVQAMVAMAHSLHIDVVAEGVETLEQLDYLRTAGCDFAQGFLFSHPVEPAEIALLAAASSTGLNIHLPR